MKYKFHDQLSKIKTNPKYVLPQDINAPIAEYLDKIGCEIGKEELARLQKSVGYGHVDLIHDDVPAAKLSMEFAGGMVAERKEYEIKKKGKWTALVYKTLKNPNVDKRKEEKKHESAK